MNQSSAFYDFLLTTLEEWLRLLAPNGRQVGGSYLLGSLDGAEGESASIALHGEKRGLYKDFGSSEKASRDLIALFCQLANCEPGNDEDLARAFTETFGFSIVQLGGGLPYAKTDCKPASVSSMPRPQDWNKLWTQCREKFPEYGLDRLVSWRGFRRDVVEKLRDFDEIGWYVGPRWARMGQPAFPIRDVTGKLTGIQHACDDGRLRYVAKTKVHPWILNRWGPHLKAHIVESRFDCVSLCDRYGWLNQTGVIVICTLGAGNGGMVRGLIPSQVPSITVWAQNDSVRKNGRIPSQEWLADVVRTLGRNVKLNTCLTQDVDWNDLLRLR
jgi:hypothetical protein